MGDTWASMNRDTQENESVTPELASALFWINKCL